MSSAGAGHRGNHLGDRVGALVDGELDPGARDDALAHVAGCSRCGEEVQQHRRLKAQLSGLPAPQPPESLLRRLEAVPASDLPVRYASWGDIGTVPEPRRRPRHRARSLLLGGGGLAVVTVTTAFAVGGPQPAPAPAVSSTPVVAPRVDTFVVEHAATTGGMPVRGPVKQQRVVDTGPVRLP